MHMWFIWNVLVDRKTDETHTSSSRTSSAVLAATMKISLISSRSILQEYPMFSAVSVANDNSFHEKDQDQTSIEKV